MLTVYRIYRELELNLRIKPNHTMAPLLRRYYGPEYVSNLLVNWAKGNHIELKFIQSGNLQQNAYIERYNCTVRYDWLNQYLFSSSTEVHDHATRWLWTYHKLLLFWLGQ